MVKPYASVKFNPGKSANFRAGQIPGGMTPAFKGFSMRSSTKRASTVISMATESDDSKDPSAMDKLIQDAFPEAEMDEILEEQRKSEVKQKTLDKIKFEKELAEEIEKQKGQLEEDGIEFDDVDGFHLFKDSFEIPYKDYQPKNVVDIE